MASKSKKTLRKIIDLIDDGVLVDAILERIRDGRVKVEYQFSEEDAEGKADVKMILVVEDER